MRVTTVGGATLGYTADTGPDAAVAPFFRDVDVLISEATHPVQKDPEGTTRLHLNAAEAGRIASEAGAKVLVLTHMWEENGFDLYRRAAEENFSGRIVIAQPGVSLEW
jgi:ribonuclease BN (tRNA processing enzyme)